MEAHLYSSSSTRIDNEEPRLGRLRLARLCVHNNLMRIEDIYACLLLNKKNIKTDENLILLVHE